MKKIITLLLAIFMTLSLFGCGKSKDVTIVEGFINDIGEITLESGEAIEKARHAYDMLSDKDKEKVENINTLKDAEYYYDKMLRERIEATDGLISEARTLYENDGNVTGAFELLNIARETADKGQLEEIDALTAEIEANCYYGTHFLNLDNITDQDLLFIAVEHEDNYDMYGYTAQSSIGSLRSFNDFTSGYSYKYTTPPKWMSDITDSTHDITFYYDDLGNVLIEYETYRGGWGYINIYIFPADLF